MMDWKNVEVSLCLKFKDVTILPIGLVAKVTLFINVL